MNAQSYLKPNVVERIFGRVLASLVGIGLVRGHFYVLEVRGRRSGRTFVVPVDPIEFEGRWGELETAFFNGPTGPNMKDQWTHPIVVADRDRKLKFAHDYSIRLAGKGW